jgi:hypothetical protein
MRLRSSHSRWVFVAALLLTAACGGEGEVGEDCSKEADSDECVDGAFCAKTKSGDLSCMKICTEKSDCPSDTECTGSKETIKVCQPKD